MKDRIILLNVVILVIALCIAGVSYGGVMGTAFTYQGRLTDANSPAEGLYDFEFEVYNDPDAGSQQGSTVDVNDVDVIDGYFTAKLDFGVEVFHGDDVWLHVGVRPAELEDPNTYSALSPRQKLTPTPYAIYAKSAGALDDSNFWNLSGNSGTNSSTNFLGTVDDVALEIRVNNKRVLRIEPDDTSPNIIGGFSGNSVTAGAKGATISGGGADFPVTDQPNIATDDYCTVAGGRDNQAGNGAGTTIDTMFSTAGGGWRNKATGARSTIAGGNNNTASGYSSAIGGGGNNEATYKNSTIAGGFYNDAKADYATISGGRSNIANGIESTVGGGAINQAGPNRGATVGGGSENQAISSYTTIGGGKLNNANIDYSTIGGGLSNTVAAYNATVGGGQDNIANENNATVGGGNSNEAIGLHATVGGGFDNTASGQYAPTVGGGHTNIASGEYATVPGGTGNEANGNCSFAAGRRAKANHQGSFVWGDSTDADFTSTVNDQFLIRASGGVGIGTTNPQETLDVNGTLVLEAGTAVNEFSTDGTLGDNSDDAVPTEKAVKSYVDSQVSTGEVGKYDGEVNSDMVEDSGANTTINFTNPFTTTAKPQFFVIVVLKQAANGLVEGAAIKAVEDIKGAAANWTGFDLTVSKYSDGSSITDTTQVFVTWMAVSAQ